MKSEELVPQPGPVVLFGSGETSPSGRKVFDQVMRQLTYSPRVALLETPAGFELNSAQVIGRVGEFISERLQNYEPRVQVIAARRRGSDNSPDNPSIVESMFQADMIFMGPGSPSYAVRQLRDSLAWQALQACNALGAAVVFASAAVVAVSLYALPVYEIYKVGEDLHWKGGLDFFGLYGLPLVFIPHWNNNDGGEELDTSRCFMGKERFQQLMEMLPPELTVLGIDEKTALIMDSQAGICQVVGLGGVTLLHTGPEHQGATSHTELHGTGLIEVAQQRRAHVHAYKKGESFPLSKIGDFRHPKAGEGVSAAIWQQALAARQAANAPPPAEAPSAEVLALLEERQAARAHKDFAASDQLRERIASQGWQVQDTPQGQRLVNIETGVQFP